MFQCNTTRNAVFLRHNALAAGIIACYTRSVSTENNIEPIYIQIAANIRALRREQRIKVKDIAALLGFTEVSSFYQIEQCRVRISLYHLMLLADLFGVSLLSMLSAQREETIEIKDEVWREF